MGSWLTSPAKPRTVDKTRENPPMGAHQVLMDARRSSTPASCQDKEASPGFDLPSVAEATGFHPKNEVQQDPILTEPQRLGSRLSRDHTQLMCMCRFCFKLSSRTCPEPPAPCPSVRSYGEGFVSRAEENDGTA